MTGVQTCALPISSASDTIDHTVDLGGTAVTGNVSSFGIDSDGELYVVNYSQGVVLRLAGSLSAPTNLRIVR